MNKIRVAKVGMNNTITCEEVQSYLPMNYAVTSFLVNGHAAIYIIGIDDHGWTLHDYVIPRLASGLIVAREVTLGDFQQAVL